MAVIRNKVTYNGEVIMDISSDTITAADLRQGVTAHDGTGAAIVGTYTPGGTTLQSKTKSYTPSATAQNETVTADSGYDGLSSVAISVGAIPQGEFDIDLMNASYYDENGVRKWRVRAGMDVWDGWLPAGEYYGEYRSRNAVAANTTITPSLTAQTVGGANWMMEGPVTVEAMPVSGTINIDDSGDWDVTYARTASVPAGTEGTPSATKGTVSNHSVFVTPSVTNSAGWIDGGTKTGTAVSVSASELVSGTLQVTQNGTKDVTNYASVNVQVPYVTYYTGTSDPPSSLGQNGDIYLKVVT